MTKEEFRHIYQSHVGAIRNYIYYRASDIALADDITQECFIKFWEKQLPYKPSESKALLYKMASNLFVDHIRKHKIETDYIQEFVFSYKSGESNNSDEDAMKQKCEKALGKLSEKERIVFLMSRKDEMTYAEIAEALNISKKAVEKRMHQALQKLKQN